MGFAGTVLGALKPSFKGLLTAALAEHEETCPAAQKGRCWHRPYTQSPKPVRQSMVGRKAGGAEAEQFDAGPD